MISINEGINGVGGSKIVVKANVVDKKFEMEFLIPGARLAFTKLRKAFNTALIMYHYDRKYHIWIQTNLSSYDISGIFSQVTFNGFG